MSIRTNLNHLDRLSALLEGARPQIELLGNAEPWPPTTSGLRLWLLLRGRAQVRSGANERELSAPALWLGGDPSTPPVELLATADDADWLRLQIGFDGPAGPLLAAQFATPQLIACDGSESPALRQVVGLICAEAAAPRCGQPALLKRAGEILFIALLRHQIEHPGRSGQLFRGLADPRLARVLVAVHEQPAAPWTLESLAATAGMSRTAFANAFRDCLQQTPGQYLAELRLALARQAVAEGRGLKEAARRSGYRSSSALSKALSRSTAKKGKKDAKKLAAAAPSPPEDATTTSP